MADRRSFGIATVLAAGLGWAVSATAAVLATHGDWQVLALPEGGCAVGQIVQGRRTGVTLLEVLISDAGRGDGAAVIALRVPTGAFLPDGIAYRHEGAARHAVALEWQSCDARRCTATGRISAAEAARLRAGDRVIAGYRPLPDAPVLNVPLSLRGLTRAWSDALACPS